jgi:CAAX protease family protein
MYWALIGLFLSLVAAFFWPALQAFFRRQFQIRPALIWLVPAILLGLFSLFLRLEGVLGFGFLLLIAAYTFAPVALAYGNGPGGGRFHPEHQRPWLDLAAILALWLPLELGVGKALLPPQLHGPTHTVAYGVAVTLGLMVFLAFRGMPGMKYRLPRGPRDFLYPLAGLLVSTVVLSWLGLQLSFISPFHVPPGLSVRGFGFKYLTIFLGVALPEEILFRSLIQNWIMQRFGFHWKSLAAAAVVFGSAHLNNAPGGFPNWRYMILATIAGLIYGRVFQSSSSVVSSAGLHAAVNTLRHTFF